MANFDFMHDEVLRASLECDYSELELCVKTGAWKAVHVLAGSIIETILIDYLVETDYANRKAVNLKNLKFFEIINACQKEGVLSENAAALSHVIREYRNLIHPEKIMRVNAKIDEDGAIVAHALVRMVTSEISIIRRQTYGLTAEQLVTKIETDPSVLPIVTNLLKSMKEIELKLFLIKKIPQKYIYLNDPFTDDSGYIPRATLARLAKSYRLAFDVASCDTKKAVAEEFIRVIKGESAEVVDTYELIFFRGTDLEYFPHQEMDMSKNMCFQTLQKKPPLVF